MARAVIAICNQKGGVSKTTTCASLGVALLHLGEKPVLMLDCDPTGALSTTFGAAPGPEEKTIYHALLERGTTLREVVRPVRDGLDLAPANRDLAAAEILLTQEPGGELALRNALRRVQDRYRFVLLDCGPNLSKVSVNALAAATHVVIPLTPAYLTLNPLGQLMATIDTVQERLNPDLRVLGMLLTQFNRRALHAQEVEARVRALFPGLLFEAVVGQSVRFQEAPAGGLTILEYEPSHPGAEAYRAFAQEVLHRVQTHQAADGRGAHRAPAESSGTDRTNAPKH